MTLAPKAEPIDPAVILAIGIEACPECGALILAAGKHRTAHFAWHERKGNPLPRYR